MRPESSNTILADGTVAERRPSAAERNIAYWVLGKTHWGKGIASAALAQFLTKDRGATSLRACGKAQFRFDTCLTKMRIPTCTRGYMRWATMAKNSLWSCAPIVAPRPPINPQRPNQAMERTATRCMSTFSDD